MNRGPSGDNPADLGFNNAAVCLFPRYSYNLLVLLTNTSIPPDSILTRKERQSYALLAVKL